MAERPTFHAGLGEYFISLRQRLGWGQRQAAQLAERRGIVLLTRQVMLRLEQGKTKNPEPTVLRAVAELYGVTYEELVARCIQSQYGVEMRPAKPGDPKRVTLGRAVLRDDEELILGLYNSIKDRGQRRDFLRMLSIAHAGLVARAAQTESVEPPSVATAAAVGEEPPTPATRIIPMRRRRPARRSKPR